MSATTDGRTTRWEQHNLERRRELVASSLRAIRRHGAGVGMDDFAAEANTSKTVFYRHFGDRTGLYDAIVDWVRGYIWDSLLVSHPGNRSPVELVHQLADTYLELVEKDPEIYRFVIARPPAELDDPVLAITTQIGNEVSHEMAAWLTGQSLPTAPANIWGHGVVGFIYSVADRWLLTSLRRPRTDVVAYIDQLFRPAFEAQATQ